MKKLNFIFLIALISPFVSTSQLYHSTGSQVNIGPSFNVGVGVTPEAKLHIYHENVSGLNYDPLYVKEPTLRFETLVKGFINDITYEWDIEAENTFKITGSNGSSLTLGNNSLSVGSSGTGSFQISKTNLITNSSRKGLGLGVVDYENVYQLSNSGEGGVSIESDNLGNLSIITIDPSLDIGAGYVTRASALNRSLDLNSNGELRKKIDDSDKIALSVNNTTLSGSLEDNDVFRVMGDGFVYATEIQVQLNPFPDYVFEEEYELMPLEGVADFIQENNHLPNVPSASEIEEDGLGLGSLSIYQMEKIEELFLYIIDMNNQLKKLRTENQELSSKLEKSLRTEQND